MTTLKSEKQRLRDLVRQRLRFIDRAAESLKICRVLEESLPPEGAILAYEPLEDEPDITPIVDELRHAGRLVLVGGKRDKPVLVPNRKVVLALIPGRAFDKKGNRVGRGGGTFDRLMAELDCPLVGVAFQEQVFEEVPAEAHDRQVDCLVSPDDGLVRFP